MKQKLLIIGPLGDIGGRELETGFISDTLSEDYNIKIFSTGNLSSKSQIFDFVSKEQVVTLNETMFRTSLWFRILSYLSYFKAGKKESVINYVSNNLAKKTGYRSFAISHIKQAIEDVDIIIICAQISSNYVQEIVEFSNLKNKPIVLRTSNTIRESDVKNNNWLNGIDLYIHHSLSNAKRLSSLKNHNYVLIDQCTFKEAEMLKIKPSNAFKSLLYVGRLSHEKGIKELVHIFKNHTIDLDLKIIGDGDLFKTLNSSCSHIDNIQLLGYLNQNEIIEHIKKADAIVIPSHEESGPLVGLEGMASARLILSTKVGAMPSRLEDSENQFWFNVNEPQTFLKAIETIKNLSPSKIEHIAEGNRLKYLKKYKMSLIKSQYKNTIFNLNKDTLQ